MQCPLQTSTSQVLFFSSIALLQDKLKKLESIITSQQVQIQNTEDMLSFNKQECKRIEEEREAIQSQFEGVQKENQELKESNLEMKKEQRKILDELEIQLSSLIKEKKKTGRGATKSYQNQRNDNR